jgi:L-ascorbate metabolism protein UlaG (beta-lactamase superfamily)
MIPAEMPDIEITSLGQAGVELRGAGRVVYVDPWLSTQLEEDQGVTRPVPPPLRPGDVRGVDLVCITHPHADHLDPPTLAAIARNVPAARFLAPAPAVPEVVAAGVPAERITGIRPHETVELADTRVTAVPAAHEPDPAAFGGYKFWLDEHGEHKALGYLVELGGLRLFHAGDTVWWPGLEQAVADLAPALAVLPINGRDPVREARNLWGNMSAEEAAAVAAAARLAAVIPCHYDGVAGNLGDPALLVAALATAAPAARAHVLAAGETLAWNKSL